MTAGKLNCAVATSLIASLLLAAPAARSAAAEASLVPWPKSVKTQEGSLDLTAKGRIVSQSPALAPLAKVLAEETHAVSGLQLATVAGKAEPGDIELVLDPAVKGEGHKLDVSGKVTVTGGNYGAVAMGTATLLQLLTVKDGRASLPCLSVTDEPAAPYRGLMIDVARRYHSIENLKRIVQLCRLYKVRYLQLHLTDDQGFMFPSKAYPLLAAQNQNGGKTYTIEQLKDLVAYADARGVTIIPEYEVPGHSAAANRAMHDLFIIAKTKPYEHHASINFCKDEVMRAVATIVGEMCEVFKSSPYFHIGGDEADLALADQNADFQAAMKKYNLPNQHELYRRFVGQMNEIVKKHGKQMIVWEGFGRRGKVAIPKDIIVMAYEIRFYQPSHLLADGYKVVNASWTPLYVVNANARPPEEIYAWKMQQFKPFGAKPADQGVIVPPSENLLGAQMCAWEQPETAEIPSLRHRLPAMMERIWNPDAGKTYQDFARRAACCDRLLDALLEGSDARAEGPLSPREVDREIARLRKIGFPLVDYHVHLKGGLTLDEALAKSRKTGIKYGIALNCGVGFPTTDDKALEPFFQMMKGKPACIGMQAEGREWTKMFSKEAIAKFDYVFTDAMTITDHRGKRARLWVKEEVDIPDKQAFMERLVRNIEEILDNEPIDIYVNPTFLPDVIAGEYQQLWTPERLRRVIAAAARNGVAIEISNRYRLPKPSFIKQAKQAGIKFTFGTNNGNRELGRVEYCLQMVRECGLTAEDMWSPKPDGKKPVQVKKRGGK